METNHERHAQEAREKEITFIQLPVHQIWAGFFEDWEKRVSWKVNLFNRTAFECRYDLVKIYRSIWRFIAQSRLIL